MSVIPSIIRGGANSYATPQTSFQFNIQEFLTVGYVNIGDYAVTQNATPNMSVNIAPGSMIVTATPTGETARKIRVDLSATYNLTVNPNVSGSTVYDVLYLYLPPATLHDPAANGDLTESATLLWERHVGSGTALVATNGIAIAEVAITSGATSIVTANITDKRTMATLSQLALPGATLGYTSISSTFSSTTVAALVPVTSLSFSITVPAGNARYLRFEAGGHYMSTTAGSGNVALSITEDGTMINESLVTSTASGMGLPAYIARIKQPTAGSHTYAVNIYQSTAGTMGLAAATQAPAYLCASYL